jgi:SAM-dependent methyltransferase
MEYLRLRKVLGDPFVKGIGVEIGAGLRPVAHKNVNQLYFLDKRTPAEFEQHFQAPPPYELLSLTDVQERFPAGLDFVTCHHVLEHIDNPIQGLMSWLGLLKCGGVLYLSVPSTNNSTDRGRLTTPIRHIIEDYFFDRAAASYESKSHIPSFVIAALTAGPEWAPWYSKGSMRDFASHLLDEIDHRDDHDLHWHTFNLDVLTDTVEAACFIAGVGSNCLLSEESDDSLYVAYRVGGKLKIPPPLAAFHDDILLVAARLKSLAERCAQLTI